MLRRTPYIYIYRERERERVESSLRCLQRNRLKVNFQWCVLRANRGVVPRAEESQHVMNVLVEGVRSVDKDNHMLLPPQWPIALFMGGYGTDARN
jgi:hypothetical protein